MSTSKIEKKIKVQRVEKEKEEEVKQNRNATL